MSLPFDFSTSLWLRAVPVWEWEALAPPCTSDADAEAAAASGAAIDPSPDGGAAATAAGPGRAAPAADPSPAERPGFRRVFKGYEIAASVFCYPADSPLSRPWLVRESGDRKPQRSDEAPKAVPDLDEMARLEAMRCRPGDDAPA